MIAHVSIYPAIRRLIIAKASDNPFPSILIVEGSAPADPAVGNQRLFIDSADHALKRVNSSGAVTVIEGGGGGGSGAMTQISKQVVAAAVASITFSGIAGTYNRLELEIVGRSDASAAFEELLLQFNVDAGANYNEQSLAANSSAASAGATYGLTNVHAGYITAAAATAGIPGTTRIIIPGYAGTTFRKQLLSTTFLNENDTAGGSFTFNKWSEWKSTAAITSILLFPASGNFVTGTTAILWGIT